MPVPQLDPPGHLAIHLELVVLTPILLAWSGAAAGAITTGRAARAFATIGVTAGFALLLIDLRARGLALAVDRVLGREWFPAGVSRIAWPTMAAAAAAGAWSLVQAIRKTRTFPAPIAAWRCGLAQALALVPIPALTLFCIWDHAPAKTTRWLLTAVASALTAAAFVLGSPWPHMIMCLLGAICCKPWRVVLAIAALAACWPLADAPG